MGKSATEANGPTGHEGRPGDERGAGGARAGRRIESQLVHAPDDGDPRFGDVVAPIHLTTTYEQAAFGRPLRYDYSRGGNPSRQVVEDQIAALEGGTCGLAFSSGMAAITAVLSLFEPGDELLVPTNIYGGTFRVLDRHFKRYGLSYRFVDVTDAEAVEAAFSHEASFGSGDAATPTLADRPADASAAAGRPAALLFESPTNPLLEVADIAALSEVAHRHGALAIVDNTFLSPYLQQPLVLGADIVLHSATKYLGGHSDVLAGLVAVKDPGLYRRLHFIHYSTGATLAPFDSYLLTRGIRTLAVRLDRACSNAEELARWLDAHPLVGRVVYPGLPRHPGYAVQQRQARRAGALLAFELTKGLDTEGFVQALGLITLAESLGAVESLICHPATMTHASIPAALRAEMGITDRLLRLSVGIEHIDDLKADLAQAFDSVGNGG
ncbi:MAG: PLP-dependent aspartate aminotransferase family protein [Coriobacteriales bacterium]|jgi:cystathionine beta-lyase|nr:PLP-dependent aspartate aminotransferase family protein [Coriobacteriales bacterium]